MCSMMRRDGAITDLQLVRYLLVKTALGKQFQHLQFAHGQSFRRAGGRSGLAKRLDNFPRNLAGHRRSARANLAQRRQQFLGRSLFQQITIGSRHQGVEDGIAVLVGRQT